MLSKNAIPNPPGYSIHEVGTCRMGDDPKTSVLNKWCQSHDHKNLFVVDGASFTSAGWQNPTMTILAFRCALQSILQTRWINRISKGENVTKISRRKFMGSTAAWPHSAWQAVPHSPIRLVCRWASSSIQSVSRWWKTLKRRLLQSAPRATPRWRPPRYPRRARRKFVHAGQGGSSLCQRTSSVRRTSCTIRRDRHVRQGAWSEVHHLRQSWISCSLSGGNARGPEAVHAR